MQKNSYDIIVIGGGAAGLMAAGTAAERGASVLLLETMHRPGRKLMITGKGRCNLSNNTRVGTYLEHIRPLPKFCLPMFSRFFVDDTLRFFHRIGLPTTEERGRRIFPRSERASDVVDALVSWNTENGVRIRCNSRVKGLELHEGAVAAVITETGEAFGCKSCILATGGRSYPATGSTGDGYRLAKECGHRIVPPLPALVPLTAAGDMSTSLADLSLKNVAAALWVDGKKKKNLFGEMLFTESGLSGPLILQLSRDAVSAVSKGLQTAVALDLKPALDTKTLRSRIQRELDVHGNAKLKTMLESLLPRQMIASLLAVTGLDPHKYCNQVNAAERETLLRQMKDWRFEITGFGDWEEAIVTAGGVHCKELDPSSLESKIVRGLFFAGEILDLDASTGGYNLQIAWSGGHVAGTEAAERARG